LLIRLTVNQTEVEAEVEGRTTLAVLLREELGLTGTHLGCEQGACGACTVIVDGASTRSCLVFAWQVPGADVTTIEGIGSPDHLHPLQAAFQTHHGLQCGFCTPGMIMSLLPAVVGGKDDEAIEEAISGNLCRCTGYRNILSAGLAARDEVISDQVRAIR
jgi:aerobic-type carbon monoxide dehydrogenase small subunit (CoxS/CutS family)